QGHRPPRAGDPAGERMSIAHVTRQRAQVLLADLAVALTTAGERAGPAALVDAIQIAVSSLEYWLLPPGDDFQLRSVIQDAEALLSESDEWPGTGILPARFAAPRQREHERVTAGDLAIRVEVTEGAKLERFFVRDISQGGMFLRSTQVLPVHSRLTIVLAM